MQTKEKNKTKIILFVAVAIIFMLQLCVPFLIIISNADDSGATILETWNMSRFEGVDDVTGTLNSNGELIISGNGMMKYIGSSQQFFGNYQSEIKKVSIKEGITNIGSYIFYYCTNLETVEIGNTVKSIESEAFSRCEKLTTITIPSSVTRIGHYAFDSCTSLTKITIPESVTTINANPFRNCSSLEKIEVNSNNEQYCDLDGVLFSKDKTNLIAYPLGRIEENNTYNIPENTNIICGHAFYNVDKLTEVEIPNTVIEIGDYAFNDANNLVNITIPDNVNKIGYYSFEKCSAITEITLSKKVNEIGTNAFINCTSLTSINVNEENEKYSTHKGILFNKDKTILIACPSGIEITEYYIPDTTKALEDCAFYNCDKLIYVDMQEGLERIGKDCFYGSDGIKSIIIPDTVTILGNGRENEEQRAFSSCTNLRSIDVGTGIVKIGNRMFSGCSSLTNVNIPNVTTLGYNAFSRCESLTSIDIPKVTEIGSSAFYWCKSLTSINMPNVTEIGDSAFYCCKSLTSIDISKVTTIKRHTFNMCESLTSINMPNVTEIGGSVFSWCKSLTSINIPEVTTIKESAFSLCTSLENIDMPKVTTIGKYAFSNCSALGNVIIFNNEIEIGEKAFPSQDSINKNVVIYCKENSAAHNYASANNVKFNINAPTITITNDGNENYVKYEKVKVEAKKDVIGINEENLKYLVTDNQTEPTVEDFTLNFKNGEEIKLSRKTGEYYLWIFAEDVLGNYEIKGSKKYYLDNLGPNIPTGIEKDEKTYEITVKGEGSEDSNSSLSGYQYRINNGNWSETINKDESYTFTNLPAEEQAIIYARAVDNLGNISEVVSIFAETLGYEYSIFTNSQTQQEEIIIVRYAGKKTEVEVPKTLKGRTVTVIGEEAFINKNTLKEVKLQKEIEKIQQGAFSGCTELTKIEMPKIINIERKAFSGCTLLTKIELPEVIEIGNEAFKNCEKLVELELPKVETIGAGAFQGCNELNYIIIHNDQVTIGTNIISETNKNKTVIYARENSNTKMYAQENNIECITGANVELSKNGNSKYSKEETIKVLVTEEVLGVQPNSLYYAISKSNSIIPSEFIEFNSGEKIKLENLSGTYYLWVKSTTEKLSSETIKCSNGYNLDSEVPGKVNITGRVEEVAYQKGSETNKNVEITIATIAGNETISGTERIEYSINDGTSWIQYNENSKPEITQEGTTKVIAREVNKVSTNGEISDVFEIKIDKTAPEANVRYSILERTREPVEVLIVAEEEIQLVEGWNYLENNKTTIAKKYTDNIEENIKIKDKAGNEAIVAIKIENIDKSLRDTIVPTVEVKYNDETQQDWTNGNITVKIIANEEIQEIEGWNLSENKVRLTKTYTENAEENIIVKDLAGNYVLVEIKITKIDKIKPKITIKEEQIEEGKYKTATVTIEEANNYLVELKKDNKAIEFTNGMKIETIGSYEIKVTDIAGNVTILSFKIAEYLTYGPYGTYEEDGKWYLINVSPETKKEKFIENLETNIEGITVKTKDSEELEKGKYVGTEMTVTIKGKEYKIIVKGDCFKGDGISNILDLLAVLYHKVYAEDEESEYKLKGANFKAGDIDKNGAIDMLDLLRILYHKERIEGFVL